MTLALFRLIEAAKGSIVIDDLDTGHLGLHDLRKHITTIPQVNKLANHDDVIKWRYFPRYWPFVRGIHRLPVNPHKGQRRGALMFSLICA